MSVEIKNLSYYYSPKTVYEHKALNRITFTVEDGDFFGIVGETGSGKSTLISHLNALTRVQTKYNAEAVLNVDGIDLMSKKPDLKTLRETVGMVFQYPEHQLFAKSVMLDVMFGPKNLGLSESECRERAVAALTAVGLDPETVGEKSPFEISGGQKRRAAIAGVLAMRPKILVLDEPTAGLDPKGKKELLALLKELKKEISIIIMVSHNMDDIAGCCNKVAVISEGSVNGVYAPEELFKKKELLESMALELPEVTKCANALADAGLDISRGIIKEEDLIKAVLEITGGAAK